MLTTAVIAAATPSRANLGNVIQALRRGSAPVENRRVHRCLFERYSSITAASSVLLAVWSDQCNRIVTPVGRWSRCYAQAVALTARRNTPEHFSAHEVDLRDAVASGLRDVKLASATSEGERDLHCLTLSTNPD